jgi:alpha-L-glutamate ligase-like protein
MNFFKKASGILGMNARNLLYIAKYNSRSNKKFADDKIFTKKFLSSRGIGVAKTYQVITNYKQLTLDFFNSLPETFVIKPNRGYGGGGILVVVAKKDNLWITASGKKLNTEFFYRHCIEILEGKYSISGVSDTVIFEELLLPHHSFRALTETGLPDIRVIVFNLVPVLAMARIPTIESEGKANMELGAIAMGIDIGTGRTTGAAQSSKFIKKMPNGEPVIGFQIPYWDEILETVSKIQNTTKIGFLGCDLVITKTGVKVLEMNARSGLKIQIANKASLKKRLEKVADLKVLTPSEGVEIAKTLFSQNFSVESEAPNKPIIGIFEQVILNLEKPQNCIAKIDLSATENRISAKFFDVKNKILDVTIAGKRLKLPIEKGRVQDADLILAGKFLTDFFIDPNKKINKNIELLTANVDEKMIQNIDEKNV